MADLYSFFQVDEDPRSLPRPETEDGGGGSTMKRRRCLKPRYTIKNHFADCYVGLPECPFRVHAVVCSNKGYRSFSEVTCE